MSCKNITFLQLIIFFVKLNFFKSYFVNHTVKKL